MPTRMKPVPGTLYHPASFPTEADPAYTETPAEGIEGVASYEYHVTPTPRYKRRIGSEAAPKKQFDTWEFLHPEHEDWPGQNQYLWFQFVIPSDITGAGMQCHIVWIADALSGDVRWAAKRIDLEAAAGSPYDATPAASDFGATGTVSAVGSRFVNRTTLSQVATSSQGDHLCVVGLHRNAESALDTMEAVAEVLYIYFTYTGD